MANNFYVTSTGKYNFGGSDVNPSDVFLEGLNSDQGISVSGNFVMGNNYVNFGVSAGNEGYGFRQNGGSVQFRNDGENWTTIPYGISISQLSGVNLGSTNEILIVNSDQTGVNSTGILTLDTVNNYVGINETNPQVTLHMTGDGPQTAQIRMVQFNNSPDAPDIRTFRYRGTPGSCQSVSQGDYLLRLNTEAYNTNITSASTSLYHSLEFDVDSTNVNNGIINFKTRIGTSNDPRVRMGIKSDGKIVIGNSQDGNPYTFPSTDGSANQILQTDGSGTLSFVDQTSGGGGTSPSGPTRSIQFNDNGSFGGVSSFTWNSGTSTLGVSGNINVTDGPITISDSSYKKRVEIKKVSTGLGGGKISLYTNSSGIIPDDTSLIDIESSKSFVEGTFFYGGEIKMGRINLAGVSSQVIYLDSSKQQIYMNSQNSSGISRIILDTASDYGRLRLYDDDDINTIELNGNSGSVVFRNDNAGVSIKFGISPNQSTSTSFILPIENGNSGQVLQTDGSGTLSFVDQTSGGGGTSPSGPVNSIQFNDNGSFGGVSGLLYHKGTSTISVNGNVFSNFGVSGLGGTSPGLSSSNSVFELITPEEFVNGVYFPQVMSYYSDDLSSENTAVYRVRVPDWYGDNGISVKFPGLANPGFRNSFETTFYGTCTDPTGSNTYHLPPVITILNNTNTIFDQRLFPSGSGTCLTFSLASDPDIALTTGYGSGVTIKSIVHSSGISMYPIGTVNYRTFEITSGGGGGGAPTISSAEIPSGDATSIIITFSEAIDISGPGTSAGDYFEAIGTSSNTLYPTSAATGGLLGDNITLSFGSSFISGETVIFSYTGQNDQYIVSSETSNPLADIFDVSVTNNLP